MANITAEMVRDLRDKTGAGMMDCKKALVESEGDLQGAIDALRKSGIAKAEKKSGRATKEGRVISCLDGNKGSMIEVLCETDFVATNEKFAGFIKSVSEKALSSFSDNGDISAKLQELEKDTLVSMISTIGENMQIRRAVRWESKGVAASYLHMGGRIGVMIDVEGECDKTLLHEICMHIAAFKPQYICAGDVPAEIIEREKEIMKAQLAGKPAEMLEKIVTGKISKWYSEVCLMKQPWIKDDKKSLDKVNSKIKVNRFVRWEVGEEI